MADQFRDEVQQASCANEAHFMKLLQQMSSTIQSLKAAKPHQCLCTIAAKSSQHDVAPEKESEDQFGEVSGHRSPLVEALHIKLASAEQELQAKKAEVEAKDDELKSRNEAYQKLSAAHQTVLKRLAHYKKLPRLPATTRGGESPFSSPVVAARLPNDKQSEKVQEATTSKHQSDAQQPSGPRQPRELVNNGTGSSDTVQFVSARPVRHAKRSSAKADNIDHTSPAPYVKEELSASILPSLSNTTTAYTQGLDFDKTATVTATPRKFRDCPTPIIRNQDNECRPVSAPHEEWSTSSRREATNELSRSFGALDSAKCQRYHIDLGEEPMMAGTNTPTPDGILTTRTAHQFPDTSRARTAQSRVIFNSEQPSHAQPLSERNPNIGNNPGTIAKAGRITGKRKRYDHGASKVGDLTEDGIMDALSAPKQPKAKGRRLQDLLEGGIAKSPSPRQDALGTAYSASKPPREKRPKLRQTAVKNLQLSDFVTRSDAARGAGSSASGHRREDGTRQCPEGCMRAECCGSAMDRFVRAAGVPRAVDQQRSIPAHDSSMAGGVAEKTVLLNEEEELRLFVDQFDRHRGTHERAASPPGYWAADMPSTQELEAIRSRTLEVERETIEKRHREATSG